MAEPFDVADAADAEPGTVLVINEHRPGSLKVSYRPNDPKVAGVVSGAGGLHAGLTLRTDGSATRDERLVALAGRVFCKAEARSSPIRPGDLLTTSGLAGHAMKAVDRQAAQGAILGKAMTALDAGTGLVLALVNLQ